MATQEELINLVQAQFPTQARAHIRFYLNQAATEMSESALVIREAKTVELDGSATQYALDSDILRVTRVVWNGSQLPRMKSPIELHEGDGSVAAYRVDAGNIHVGYVASKTLNPLPTSNGDVTMYCRVKVDDLSQFLRLYDSDGNAIVDSDGNDVYVVGDALTEGPGLPAAVQIGLAHYALREFHMAAGNVTQSREYDKLWNRAVKVARRYANQNQNTFEDPIIYLY